MSSTAASGFVFLLLSVKVIQSQDGWEVTYTPNLVCGVIGSKVELSCRYEYPSTVKEDDIRDRTWYRRNKIGQFLPIKKNPQFSGRVRNECHDQRCNLIISNLRQSDAALFQFRFTTNKNSYTGKPGVTLAVTDPGFKVLVSKEQPNWAKLKCRSSYPRSPELMYIWYRNGKKYAEVTYFSVSFGSSDSYSCSQKRQEERCSPPVYAPRRPSVSVSPSGEIVEGSSVTLNCSSDANPAASYTWYKVDEDFPKASARIFVITNFRAEHTGKYSCEAKNTIGRSHSTFHLSLAAQAAIVDIKTMVLQSIYWILAVLVLSSLILFFLWFRKKKAVISTTEPDENAEALKLDVHHAYENISDIASQPEDTEEFKDYPPKIYNKLLKIASD